jgi:hypothetical protein
MARSNIQDNKLKIINRYFTKWLTIRLRNEANDWWKDTKPDENWF